MSQAAPGAHSLKYVPALDGLRAIAVSLVILVHAAPGRCPGGWVGVDVFFVLSGYLISSILLGERRRTGRVALGAFYARRALRLFPALFFLLGAYALVATVAMSHPRVHLRAIAATALYAMSWVRSFSLFDDAAVAHTWSLSIEEQFYLVYPWLLLALTARARSARRCGGLLIAACAVIAALRLALWLHGASAMRLYHGFDVRADSLLVGCALSFALADEQLAPKIDALALLLWPLGALGILAVLFTSDWSAEWLFAGGFTVIALCAALLVARLAASTSGPIVWVLTRRPMIALGKISYGVYLWHYPILLYGPTALERRLHSHTAAVLLSVAVAIGIAAFSYRFVESPFLRRKAQFSR